ncbi:hypothetical protein DM02DRAFT_659694 [Periconia macrospinosa]|uniref:F-box domain-containing protein n=1 Tax=Periconia macrospinosa TaxID=97972 RepID=A0A2V1DE71_9PLEO|nr:hypothetical protein DM02DRAFT_659694 [Periconia macrospinosa]
MPRLLLDLPTELLLGIASWCSTPGINTLCQTSRALHTICTPLLYSTIDLSVHNADIGCESLSNESWRYRLVPPNWVYRKDTRLDIEIFRRQGLLLRTFAEQGAERLGGYVKTLRWTVIDPGLLGWGEGGETDYRNKGFELYEPEDEPMWTLFRSAVNVSSVDLCWLRRWREVTPPGPLFPSLKSLRLSGRMSHEFISCILDSHITDRTQQQLPLEHLSLNNLFQWGYIDPQPPRLAFTHIRTLADFLRANLDTLRIDNGGLSMVGHIDPLIGHLCHLKTLQIGTVAYASKVCYLPSSLEVIDIPTDTSVYTQWAHLLASLRPTLEALCFDQGYDPWCPGRNRSGTVPTKPYRTMDWLFITHILPVLLAAPWPRMKRMHISGVGRVVESRDVSEMERLAIEGEWRTVKEVRREGVETRWLVERVVVAVPEEVRERLKGLLRGGGVGLGRAGATEVDFVWEEEQGRDWEHMEWEEWVGTGVPDLLLD